MQIKQRLDALTSLRFIAAAMIVITHEQVIFASQWAQLVQLVQGVSFFFVLSGFILTWNYPVLADWTARRKFWLARFARIWPLHLVTCVLWIALIFDFQRSVYFPGIIGFVKLAANLLLLQAWVPVQAWGLSFNSVSWSISVEFFFYALFPALILMWRTRWHQLLLIQGAVVVVLMVIATHYSLQAKVGYDEFGLSGLIYTNPLVRVFEFSIGIATAWVVRQIAASKPVLHNNQWLALELAALGAVSIGMLAAAKFAGIEHALGTPAQYYFSTAGLWLLWALLIGVFALSQGPLARLLSLRFAVFLGEISFALYLCHYMVVQFLGNYTAQVQSYGMLGYMAFWSWCLLFATALFIGIETPCRKFILAVAAKSGVFASLRTHFRIKELLALAFLVGMTCTMFFFRPTTIVRLDQASVQAFLQPSPENITVPSGALFDGRYEILGMRMHPVAQDVEIEVLLRSTQKVWAHDFLALHLNDEKGEFIAGFNQKLDFGRADTPAGACWIQHFKLPQTQIAQATSVGLVMYDNPGLLLDITGGSRDWGGKRLILPLKK